MHRDHTSSTRRQACLACFFLPSHSFSGSNALLFCRDCSPTKHQCVCCSSTDDSVSGTVVGGRQSWRGSRCDPRLLLFLCVLGLSDMWFGGVSLGAGLAATPNSSWFSACVGCRICGWGRQSWRGSRCDPQLALGLVSGLGGVSLGAGLAATPDSSCIGCRLGWGRQIGVGVGRRRSPVSLGFFPVQVSLPAAFFFARHHHIASDRSHTAKSQVSPHLLLKRFADTSAANHPASLRTARNCETSGKSASFA
jgi:hypothetical protein